MSKVIDLHSSAYLKEIPGEGELKTGKDSLKYQSQIWDLHSRTRFLSHQWKTKLSQRELKLLLQKKHYFLQVVPPELNSA